ncbi:MAG: ribonuclease HII, partial [Cypionkella sp.]
MARQMPDDSYERAVGGGLVAGVDEVGRGPLAGPVTAAAVRLTPGR